MLRPLAILFGSVFLLFGVMGFLPYFEDQGLLLGIFRVNFEHNALHLFVGILGILCGLSGKTASRTFFIASGLVYGVLAAVGWIEKTDMAFAMIAINTADNILHAILGIAFLIIGFSVR